MIVLRKKTFSLWSSLNRYSILQKADKRQPYLPDLYGKYVSEEEYNKRAGFPPPSPKPRPKTYEEEQKELLNELKTRYPELGRDLEGLKRLVADKSISSKSPKFGDGDEYPTLDIYYESGGNTERVICWQVQYGYIGINPTKGFWCTQDKPEKKINLKQFLLAQYNRELSNYKEMKRTDGYGWEEEEYDEVLKWIEALIGGVKKYL